MRDLLVTFRNLLFLLIFIFLVFNFFIGVMMAPNDDMRPRISAGDFLCYYRLNSDYVMKNAVVFEKNDTTYIGRIVATPGQTVEVTKEENLVVDGNTVIDDMIFYKTPQYQGFVTYPLTLGSDEYFILGDKREGAEDSRYFGPVKKDEIKGLLIGQFRKDGI